MGKRDSIFTVVVVMTTASGIVRVCRRGVLRGNGFDGER